MIRKGAGEIHGEILERRLRTIAAAIGMDVTDIVKHEKLFDQAAHWYGLDCGLPRRDRPRPRRTPPSRMRTKLQRIAKSADRLLKHLEVQKTEDAYGGPGNFELLDTMAWAENYDEDAVVTATRRVGRLMEILEAIDATSIIDDCAREAADEVKAIGRLTVRPGHQGVEPVNNWIASMMMAYREITGSEPVTSVGGFDRPNEGVACGPFIRFLGAAGNPIGIEYTEDAWRSRVRTLEKHGNSPKRKI